VRAQRGAALDRLRSPRCRSRPCYRRIAVSPDPVEGQPRRDSSTGLHGLEDSRYYYRPGRSESGTSRSKSTSMVASVLRGQREISHSQAVANRQPAPRSCITASSPRSGTRSWLIPARLSPGALPPNRLTAYDQNSIIEFLKSLGFSRTKSGRSARMKTSSASTAPQGSIHTSECEQFEIGQSVARVRTGTFERASRFDGAGPRVLKALI